MGSLFTEPLGKPGSSNLKVRMLEGVEGEQNKTNVELGCFPLLSYSTLLSSLLSARQTVRREGKIKINHAGLMENVIVE